MTAVDMHTLTGAYALHTLSGGEREAVERHLGRCDPCAEEVAGFTAAAARQGLASALTPRPELKARVLRRIASERQQTARRRTVAATPLPRRARASARARPSRWLPAACPAAAAVPGTGTVWQHQRAEDAGGRARRAERTARDVSAVLTAPDARTRTARLAEGARGTVVVSHGLDRAVFAASDMAEPPPGRVYQLWLADGGRMRTRRRLREADLRTGRPPAVPGLNGRAPASHGRTVHVRFRGGLGKKPLVRAAYAA
ncbi:anti-sigma factor [Streptomyces spinosirectus]